MSSILGLGGVVKFLSYIPNPGVTTIFDLGPADQLPVNSIIVVEQAQAALIPASEGFIALSLICPHLGCEVDAGEEIFECPCHGSRFSLDGEVLKGPADQPLRPLQLEISEEGHLILDTSET